MPPAAPNPPVSRAPPGAASPRLRSLPRRTYRLRILGMGLAALPMVAVMHELGSPWPAWAWMIFSCAVWPHLAYFIARRSADPFHAELRNFTFDSVLAASWVPLMHFNLLPSVVLVTVVMADKINAGVRGLWQRSLPGMLLGLVAAGLCTGFAVQPETSQLVMLASLPILVIHTLAVAVTSHQLVRKLQRQNLQLSELTRLDGLTGLDSRGHWQDQAEALLRRHQATGAPATLLLLDVDHFKDINDRHGHGVGDDVLQAIAELLRAQLRADSHAGRLGGDEYVVALPIGVAEAMLTAERLRAAVELLQLPERDGLRCSVSIGLAAAPPPGQGLRDWIEAADQALYRAKNAGRNRTAGRDEVAAARE